uniref:Thiosulfate sulfurtransferase/rhodanese-like domain-containing protein 1 n=1 Tax=Poecilia latipinna TaxID=48699 RepID=A0A3B3V0R2_9TELE
KRLFFFLVTYEELKALLAKSKDLILIDVRETDEVNKGRIPRSTHIALGTVETAFKMSPEDFQATYGIPKPALDAPELVFYCRSGKRSAEAISKARELGYVTARNYTGSYLDWSRREG